MVLCAVIGCYKRSDRDKDVSFYRIPAVINHIGGERERELSERRRDGFLAALSRQDINKDDASKYRVCSMHFVSGKPAALYDELNPDWLPTLRLGHCKRERVLQNSCTGRDTRYDRMKRRKEQTQTDVSDMCFDIEMVAGREEVHEEVCTYSTTAFEEEGVEVAWESIKYHLEFEQGLRRTGIENVVSEDVDVEGIEDVDIAEVVRTVEQNTEMVSTLSQTDVRLSSFSESDLQGNEAMVLFYTGLPTFQILKEVFDHVALAVPKTETSKLTNFEQFMLVMLKLRLNARYQDLAYRFTVSVSTVSRIFLNWIKAMYVMLAKSILWPDQETRQKTMPDCFQVAFGKKVAVILDCFEIFIERPSGLHARACTWSNYKHHNTAKVLLGIAPQGVISYVSKCWGGRVSDKNLTENCGILNKLTPGDIILADRGGLI